ncbi:MAG TPA: right-handed parallel beta-helix repeat-containing protein, partial [Planctomycetaceae bacterium]|nr:right-handed parallel beta-helix repeat-containing protein [Planctomycetaceae bacterium]
EPIEGPWERYKAGIYKTQTRRRFEQLFVDGRMMLEARWPNTTFEKLLTRDGWASAGPGSAYQTLRDPELAMTGVDWTGATAVLNVAHQFWTWSRPVLNHRRGSDTFEYRIKMNPMHSQRKGWWDDDFYYLIGKLETLDHPTEWYLDKTGTLYLWPPDGRNPSGRDVRVKARDYGFRGADLRHVQLSGFHFFACTFVLERAEHCRVENCHLRFPSFVRGVPDAEEPPRKSAGTRISGRDNLVRNCSLAYCANFGIEVLGQRNVVENCLIHDVNWSGTLRYTAISLNGDQDAPRPANAARHNTVYNVGNAIITSNRNRYGIIEYNHVHHGGLISSDVSLIYTCLPYAMGNEIRYNWVHNSLSPNNSLGIRGDDKTRGLRVHHNVVWNIRRDAIVVKGGKNRVYNNTCFANGASDILLFSGREVDKWWQKWVKAYEHQNEDSLLVNNCARVIVSTRRRRDPGRPGDHSNNYTGSVPKLVDPE